MSSYEILRRFYFLQYVSLFISYLFQIGEECLACRNNVAAFDMSYFAKFFITGPDAQKAVDWIFTANMQKPAGTFFVFSPISVSV